jgi:quercetin dioxygenase-like cupin family protein
MYKKIFSDKVTKLLVILSLISLNSEVQADILDKNRIEKDRGDIVCNSPMEVISSISTFKAGDKIPLHFHNGIETAYTIQGATLISDEGKKVIMRTGDTLIAMRNRIHGGVTIAPQNELKLFTVHIIDKNKPLYNLK